MCILTHVKQTVFINVRLCHLLAGNFYNMGATRIQELVASAAVMGVNKTHVTVINDK